MSEELGLGLVKRWAPGAVVRRVQGSFGSRQLFFGVFFGGGGSEELEVGSGQLWEGVRGGIDGLRAVVGGDQGSYGKKCSGQL